MTTQTQRTPGPHKSIASRMASVSAQSRFHIWRIAGSMLEDREAQDVDIPRTKAACDECLRDMPDMKRWEACAITSLARELSLTNDPMLRGLASGFCEVTA